MNMDVDDERLLKEVLERPAEARAAIAARVMESLAPDSSLTSEQEAGIRAGLESIRAGRTVPLEEVFLRIDASRKR